jgi:hypothetical protein
VDDRRSWSVVGGPALVRGAGGAPVHPRGRGADGKWAAVVRPEPRSGDLRIPWFRCAGGVRTARRHRRADVGRSGRGHEPVGTRRLGARRASADRRRVVGASQGRRAEGAVSTVHYGLLEQSGTVVSAGPTECRAGAADRSAGSAAAADCWSTVDDGSGERRASRGGAARAAAADGPPSRPDAQRRQIRPGLERAGDRRGRRDTSPPPADLRRPGAGRGRKRSIGPDEQAEQLR